MCWPFPELAATGHVEMLANSPFPRFPVLRSEFVGRSPCTATGRKIHLVPASVFRNTELIHSNSIGAEISDILAASSQKASPGFCRTQPHQVYALPQRSETAILWCNANA